MNSTVLTATPPLISLAHLSETALSTGPLPGKQIDQPISPGSLRHAAPAQLPTLRIGERMAQAINPERELATFWRDRDLSDPEQEANFLNKIGNAKGQELATGVKVLLNPNVEQSRQVAQSLQEVLNSSPKLAGQLAVAGKQAPLSIVVASQSSFDEHNSFVRHGSGTFEVGNAMQNGKLSGQYIALSPEALQNPEDLREALGIAAARAEVERALLSNLEGSSVQLTSGGGLGEVLDALSQLRVAAGTSPKVLGTARSAYETFGGNLCSLGYDIHPCGGATKQHDPQTIAQALNKVMLQWGLGEFTDGSRLEVAVTDGGALVLTPSDDSPSSPSSPYPKGP
jgi:hypothetical protein